MSEPNDSKSMAQKDPFIDAMAEVFLFRFFPYAPLKQAAHFHNICCLRQQTASQPVTRLSLRLAWYPGRMLPGLAVSKCGQGKRCC